MFRKWGAGGSGCGLGKQAQWGGVFVLLRFCEGLMVSLRCIVLCGDSIGAAIRQ